MRNSKLRIIFAIMMLLLVTTACTLASHNLNSGHFRTETRSIEQGEIEVVQTEIKIPAGELDVNGGTMGLMQADFTYNVAEMKPEVKLNGDVLTIHTPESTEVTPFWNLDDYRNEWDLRFNNEIPMEMKVFLGTGQANLNLGDLTISKLDVDTGTGKVNLDLSSSSALARLRVSTGVGVVNIDLTGNWQTNLDAFIDAGVGDLTLLLPSSACVLVTVEGGISNTNATGMTKDGEYYFNNACGQSDEALRIDINTGIGKINLNLDD